MNEGRRPILDAERPHAEALGRLVRSLRDEVQLTQAQLGKLATLQASSVSAIERGRRRTRRSTLARIVAVLVAEHRREIVLEELVEATGPALAPESDWAERAERRRRRRELRDLPGAIDAMRAAIRSSRGVARYYPEGHPRRATATELADSMERHLADLEAKAAEQENQPARGRGPTSDPRRPAWSEWQAFLWEVTGGRMRGALTLTAAQRQRYEELTAAKDAEAAELVEAPR